jgi:hypothetical protein
VISEERIQEIANDYFKDDDLIVNVLRRTARESAIACIEILEHRASRLDEESRAFSAEELRLAAAEIRERL